MIGSKQITEFGLREIDDFRNLANRIIDLIEITTDRKETDTLMAALEIVLANMHKREDGTVDDNAIYASKVELTDENVMMQVEKGNYEVLQIGAYYTNLMLKREYPVYTTQRKEGLKDIIDLMIYAQVFPSVLLGKDEKPLYWDVFYPVESQTYRIICVFRPELGSISTLMGQLNVFRDYIVHDQGVKEIFETMELKRLTHALLKASPG